MSGSINHINGYKFGAGTSYWSSTNPNPPPPITWNNGKYDFSLTSGIGSNSTSTINFTGEQGTGSIISPELTEYDQLRSDGPLNASVDVVTFENGGFSYFKESCQTHYYGVKIAKKTNSPDIHGTILLIWAISMVDNLLKNGESKLKILKP